MASPMVMTTYYLQPNRVIAMRPPSPNGGLVAHEGGNISRAKTFSTEQKYRILAPCPDLPAGILIVNQLQ